jgi:hypothetical protein
MKSVLVAWLGLCGALFAHSLVLAAAPVDTAKSASAWVGKTVDARGIGVTIEFDTSDAPDLREWGEKAGKIAAEWYPKIDKLLASEGFSPPKSVEIRFRKDFRGLAATTGHTITIQPDWVRKHPDDFGMVVHELTHVVQQYPRRGQKPGWLVEGIADYIRLVKFEPKAPRPRLDPDKARYTDAYKTTAMFLEFAEKKHDAELVKKLNAALRDGVYSDSLWKQATGKSLDDLWSEFADSLRRPAKKVSVEKSASR